MKLTLKEGPIDVEVFHDFITLDVETPTALISSSGKNKFGAGYDPATSSTFIAALENPLQIRPSGANQAPFSLQPGQGVEVDSQGAGAVEPLGQTTPGADTSGAGQTIFGPTTAADTGSVSGVSLLDHAMASQVDEKSSQVFSRADTFSPTASKAYSWLKLGRIDDAHQVEVVLS